MEQVKKIKYSDAVLYRIVESPFLLTGILSIGYGFVIIILLFFLKFPLTHIFLFGLGVPFVCIFLLLPLEYSSTIFFIFMMLNHYYLSPVIFPIAWMEIHPRELMNLLIFTNFGVNIVFRRVYWRGSIFLLFSLLYVLFFVYIAVIGFLSGYDPQRVIAEIRFPAFFLSSFIFPFAWKSLESLRKSLNVILGVAFIIAVGTYGLFLYTFLTGNLIRTQNFLGEFLPAKIGPFRMQEVRFNGHLFFEVWFGVLLAQFLNTFKQGCEKKYRWVYFFCLLFFIPPILILMMNTALVSVFFASALIVVMSLPSKWKPLALLLFTFCVLFGLIVLGVLFYLDILSWTNSKLGISLQARLVEISGALENFFRRPLHGAGMGSQFEGLGLGSNFWKDLYAQTTYQTLHNLWVYWLFKGGIIGFAIIFFSLVGILLWSGYIINILIPQSDRGFWLGYWGVLVAQVVVMSLAFPRLSYPIGQVYLAFSIGTFIILEEAYTQKNKKTKHIY